MSPGCMGMEDAAGQPAAWDTSHVMGPACLCPTVCTHRSAAGHPAPSPCQEVALQRVVAAGFHRTHCESSILRTKWKRLGMIHDHS